MAQKRPTIEDGILIYHQDGHQAQLVVDSPAWYVWLQTASTFTFCSEHGSFTAQKEQAGNQRGGLYWRAYYIQHGKVRRANLGQSKKLTLDRLKSTAFQLFEAGDEKMVSAAQALDKQALLARGMNHTFHQQAEVKETPHEEESVTSGRSRLPVPLTSFIGRAREVAAVQDLLHSEKVRLVTLTGPGGSGKTRLGLQVAALLSDVFPDGMYFVNLAPVSGPELVVPTIAQTFALKEMGERPLFDVLIAYLQEKQLLLLLDNFEQVVSAASQVVDLLIACPKLKVLVTSRTVLHVRGEQEFAVPPLALPDPQQLPDLVELSQCEAVALFIMRAQAVKPDFQVTNANAPAVAEICTRLDGLPLAIELAASRSKLLPPQAMLARLDQRLQVLTSGAQDAPMRQQTLRNSITWSYDLLKAEQQQLLRRLSVFIEGCTIEAIEAMCGALDKSKGAGWVLDGVASLIDTSLLQQKEQEGDEPRLVMLEIIREYGWERLTASGEEESVRDAHAGYYLAFVEEVEPRLKGAKQLLWLKRLDREQENLRTALSWLITHEEGEKALRFCGALWWFWHTRGYWLEGQRWLNAALVLPSAEERTAVRARALCVAGELAAVQGDLQKAHVLLNESVTLCQELEDDHGMVLPLSTLGRVMTEQGDHAAAALLMKECITLCRKIDSNWELSRSLITLGYIEWIQGDLKQAITLTQESLMLAREMSDKARIAHALNNLGHFFWEQGDLVQARAYTEEGLLLLREVDDKFLLSSILGTLGSILVSQGDLEQAVVCFIEGYSKAQELGHETHITEGHSLERERENSSARHLIDLAKLAFAQQQLMRATRLFATIAGRPDINKEFRSYERAGLNETVSNLRALMGEQAFQIAWSEGHIMSIEQILEAPEHVTMLEPVLTVSSPSSIVESSPSSKYPDGLTSREVEVLLLVAQGLTNEQVAELLVISPRTVNSHLTSIYSKIGVSTRSAATRYAIKHHFV